MAVLLLWLFMFLISDIIIESQLAFNIIIDDYLVFSYPISYQVDNIFVSSYLKENTIETNISLKKPEKQEFSSYKSLKGKFSFNYPSAFYLDEKEFSGTDILYHIDFREQSKETFGFVQVWNLPYDLKDFLEKSKQSSTLNYKYFEAKSIKVNGLPGYYWNYSLQSGDDKYYKGNEVFLSKGDLMYRISFFMPENNWNKNQSKIFWRMVKSFKTI
ncbi:MAG: PsbP-related protein [Acetivibrionales bacterium]